MGHSRTAGNRNKPASMPNTEITGHVITKLLKIKIKLKYFSKELQTMKVTLQPLKRSNRISFYKKQIDKTYTHTQTKRKKKPTVSSKLTLLNKDAWVN